MIVLGSAPPVGLTCLSNSYLTLAKPPTSLLLPIFLHLDLLPRHNNYKWQDRWKREKQKRGKSSKSEPKRAWTLNNWRCHQIFLIENVNSRDINISPLNLDSWHVRGCHQRGRVAQKCSSALVCHGRREMLEGAVCSADLFKKSISMKNHIWIIFPRLSTDAVATKLFVVRSWWGTDGYNSVKKDTTKSQMLSLMEVWFSKWF